MFQDIDLNHYRIGKIEGFEVLKKVKVRGICPCTQGDLVTFTWRIGTTLVPILRVALAYVLISLL